MPQESRLEKLCEARGIIMTDPRRVIARVLAEAQDHPSAEEVFKRASQMDRKIGMATVYRTLRLFEEAGVLARHDFREGVHRYEEIGTHHDHLIDMRSGAIIEFQDEVIEARQRDIAARLGYKLIDHRLELYGVPIDGDATVSDP